MIIIDDSANHSVSNVLALGSHEEGFSLDDYVVIKQDGAGTWAGQIISPNANVILNGASATNHSKRLRATLQQFNQPHEMESVQIYEIQIIAEFKNDRLITSRSRPIPGSLVTKLPDAQIQQLTGLPNLTYNDTETSNAIGVLLNSEKLPMGVTKDMLAENILVAGVKGSGKSNLTANLAIQSVEQGFCTIVHDTEHVFAAPQQATEDSAILEMFKNFKDFGCRPRGCNSVIRIGIFGYCDPDVVDVVIGFNASEFLPHQFASLFFTANEDQRAFDILLHAAEKLRTQVELEELDSYTTTDILSMIKDRMNQNKTAAVELLDEGIVNHIVQSVEKTLKQYRWLDCVGKPVVDENQERGQHNMLMAARARRNLQLGVEKQTNSASDKVVSQLDILEILQPGKMVVVDHTAIRHDQTYAFVASIFINQIHSALVSFNSSTPTIQVVTDAHQLFDEENHSSPMLLDELKKLLHSGKAVNHSLLLNVEHAGEVPRNWLKLFATKFILRQTGIESASHVMHSFPPVFTEQTLQLGTGHALAQLSGFRFPILIEIAPGPFKLGI